MSVPTFAVITPVMPARIGREVNEAITSVGRQTLRPQHHLLWIDYEHRGDGHHQRNMLALGTEADYLVFLDDDDYLMRTAFATFTECIHQNDWPDVVVGLAYNQVGHECDYTLLEQRNWFNPSQVAIRRETFLMVGGFPTPQPPLWDDWALWLNLLHADATFVCCHEFVAMYRRHAGGISQGADFA